MKSLTPISLDKNDMMSRLFRFRSIAGLNRSLNLSLFEYTLGLVEEKPDDSIITFSVLNAMIITDITILTRNAFSDCISPKKLENNRYQNTEIALIRFVLICISVGAIKDAVLVFKWLIGLSSSAEKQFLIDKCCENSKNGAIFKKQLFLQKII